MRSLKSLLCFVFALMLCLCLAAPAKAQCNAGFNGFAAFGGPVAVPFGFNAFAVAPQPVFGFGVQPVGNVNIFAGGGHNRGLNVNVGGNRGFNVNSRGFNASGAGNNVQLNERFGPLGRLRSRSFRSGF